MPPSEITDSFARTALRRIFDAAVASADPGAAVLRHLPERPRGRCVVVGAGKAAAAMAAALDAAWPEVDLSGVVVTRDGHAVPAGRIRVLEASHPVPDERSAKAAREILAAVRGCGPQDLVVALISGGGSALMVAPGEGLSLAEKRALNTALLASGASISEMNTVRRHLSAIKGGRLARAAAPARVVTLMISDVPGDAFHEIASGPTVPDPTTPQDAAAILRRTAIAVPEAVLARLGGAADPVEIPPGEAVLIASPAMALAAAAQAARDLGLGVLSLGDRIEGEAREVGKVFAGMALASQGTGHPIAPPAVILSGGETTVTLGATPGRGGRNTEFLLSLAIALKGAPGIWAVAGDSDGIDGVEEAAGALVGPQTLEAMRAAGAEPRAALDAHDSYTAFRAAGDLVVTGPTLTNVNDIRALLVAPPG